MKTFLIVLVILALLGITIFLLVRKPEKVINDDAVIKPADVDIDKHQFSEETHKSGDSEDACLQEGIDYSKESEKVVEEIKEEIEEEVHIPEHCRISKCDKVLPNKYFFNIHKYTSKKGKEMFCVVCNAVINNKNYRVIVKNSYYPYLGSYTLTLMNNIESMFKDDKMSVEDFIKLGSTNFVGVGEILANF